MSPGPSPLVQAARLFATQLRISGMAAMQYRVGFWSEGLLSVLWSLIGVVPLVIAVEHRGDVVGWGPWQLMVLTGFFMMISGVFGALVQPALVESMHHIRRGTLDHVLLRPADSLVLCLTTEFNPWRFVEVLFGAGLVAVSLWQLAATPRLIDLAAVALSGLAGVLALYALGVLCLCLSFSAQQLQNLTMLIESTLDFSRWPIDVFSGLLKAVFTFVVPLAILTTYPAQAVLGRLTFGTLLAALGTAAALLLIARLSWRVALRGYTSASS